MGNLNRMCCNSNTTDLKSSQFHSKKARNKVITSFSSKNLEVKADEPLDVVEMPADNCING